MSTAKQSTWTITGYGWGTVWVSHAYVTLDPYADVPDTDIPWDDYPGEEP